MTTYLAWVLLVQLCTGLNCATTFTVDNIASREECERVRPLFAGNSFSTTARCIEVRKVKP